MHDEGRQPIAKGHLSDSGDLKITAHCRLFRKEIFNLIIGNYMCTGIKLFFLVKAIMTSLTGFDAISYTHILNSDNFNLSVHAWLAWLHVLKKLF